MHNLKIAARVTKAWINLMWLLEGVKAHVAFPLSLQTTFDRRPRRYFLLAGQEYHVEGLGDAKREGHEPRCPQGNVTCRVESACPHSAIYR